MDSRISIAGVDRTKDVLPRLEQNRPVPESLRDALECRTAPQLAEAGNEAEYVERLIRLLRDRDSLVTTDFDVAHRNSLAGRLMARFKRVLWKLCRYQHDYMAGQQNSVNFLFSSIIEFEHNRHEETIRKLEQRIAALEKQLTGDE